MKKYRNIFRYAVATLAVVLFSFHFAGANVFTPVYDHGPKICTEFTVCIRENIHVWRKCEHHGFRNAAHMYRHMRETSNNMPENRTSAPILEPRMKFMFGGRARLM